MNHSSFSRLLFSAAFAAAALGAATAAEARPEVYVSIGLQTGPAWVEQAPLYVRPQPLYVRPVPVYVQPVPAYVRPSVTVWPREVFERPRWGHDARYEWERERAWRHAERLRHERHDGWRGDGRRDDRGRGHRD